MRPRPGGTPYDFDGQPGETARISIAPIGVGNTFVVAKPAVLASGGAPDSQRTVYAYTLDRPPGEVQLIRLKFSFPAKMPENVSPSTWPRFDISVQGDMGDTSVHDVPDVLQSSIVPAPSEQDLDLVFRVVAPGARRKPTRKKSG